MDQSNKDILRTNLIICVKNTQKAVFLVNLYKPNGFPRVMTRDELNNDNGQLTTRDVRDEIVECFIKAQGSREFGTAIVKKQFKDAGVDYDNPTKEGLYEVMTRLSQVASSFRDQETINANFQKVQKILKRCC